MRIKKVRNEIFLPRSVFCCQGFKSLWENRAKRGLSVIVEQDDHQPLFGLQMRGLDSDKEEQYTRIPKAKTVNKNKLSEIDDIQSCELTLWTRARIFYCPCRGKALRWFYARNWQTLFAPVPKHRLPEIADGEK